MLPESDEHPTQRHWAPMQAPCKSDLQHMQPQVHPVFAGVWTPQLQGNSGLLCSMQEL